MSDLLAALVATGEAFPENEIVVVGDDATENDIRALFGLPPIEANA